jgi:hypothetical protein
MGLISFLLVLVNLIAFGLVWGVLYAVRPTLLSNPMQSWRRAALIVAPLPALGLAVVYFIVVLIFSTAT